LNKLITSKTDYNRLPLIITNPEKFSEKEKIYLELRKQEGRIYTDEEVKLLPKIPAGHPLAFEWKIRKKSSEKLVKYLSSKKLPLTILEIGCGNGWLSYSLAKIAGSEVTGLDINLTELNQATNVFSDQLNLQFVYADIFDTWFDEKKFNIIVMAAAVQYFPEFEKLIDRLLSLLAKGGEIHLLDSPFYKSEKESDEAHKRSADYFSKRGSSSMSQYYFHHSRLFLNNYNFRLIKPSLVNKISYSKVFPWVIIYKT